MVHFLTEAWLGALDEAVRDHRGLADLAGLAGGEPFVVEQVVIREGGGEFTYHLRVTDGSVGVSAGPAADTTIRFRQDEPTAREIASGRLSAQRAFMAGRLQVGGDLRAVIDRGPALASLADVFATVRSQTDGLDPPP